MRKRKEPVMPFCYSTYMDIPLSGRLAISELLAAYPRTVPVFLELRMSCVGCHLARFCTLEDVVRVYGLALEDLLERLRKAVQLLPKE